MLNKIKQRQATHKARKAKARANHIDDFKHGTYFHQLRERNRRRSLQELPPIPIRGLKYY